ncbi:CLUMA_CG003252, isoform A [Clunio marinus]|uniref:CLUMA_CG003252, isoform A n=1 Tax=Clunio marinus TaxID=568069 RepID=A0A1J1HNQ9_9DIPT|nr:CLUMA_CG003252, isoform A [Clunio marinus]
MNGHNLLLVYFLLGFVQVQGGNILFLSPVPSPSHHIFNRVLGVGLAEKGHNVTFLSADLDKRPIPNLHYVHLEKTYETIKAGQEEIDILAFAELTAYQYLFVAADYFELVCTGNLASKGIDELLNYPKDFKFDVVIYDFTFGPCVLPLLARFNYPVLISITAFSNPPYTTDLVGGQKYPGYLPHYMLNIGPKEMNLMDRINNHFLFIVDWMTRRFSANTKMEKLAREKFSFDFPSMSALQERTALIFVNSDNSFDLVEPLEPNMIQIGGMQITPPKPIAKDLEDFISRGKKGTVLMSLGTNVKSNMLGNEHQKRNLNKALRSGMAVKVDFTDFTLENFKSKINTVLEDSKYSQKALHISKLFRDKPQKPLDVAIWWTEFAMRNPNLDHMRSKTLTSGWFVSRSYDVILLFIVLLHLFVFAIKKVVTFMRCKSNKKTKKE